MLEYIADQEGIELPRHLAERVAENSKQNLRQAIRSLEASWQAKYADESDKKLPLYHYSIKRFGHELFVGDAMISESHHF